MTSSSSPRIALISPAANALSETFIQKHKRELSGTVLHYFNGYLPRDLEGEGRLVSLDFKSRLRRKLKKAEFDDIEEQSFYESLVSQKIDVVLAEYGPTAVKVLPACKAAGIPLIVHFHGYDASKKDVLQKYQDGYRAVFNYAKGIVGVSQVMLDNLESIGADRAKLAYAPCQPDLNYLELNLNRPDIAQFLFVGRFVDKKAPYYLLLAFKHAIDHGMKARLIMIGDGALLNTTRNLCHALNLDDYVELKGALPHSETQKYLSKSTGYVQHSITADDGDTEGTPVAVMEASCAGIPVISTLHAGIPDVVKDGQTGILVNEHDFEAMGDAMLKLSQDKDMVERMGGEAKRFMSHWLKEENSISKLNKLIEAALL